MAARPSHQTVRTDREYDLFLFEKGVKREELLGHGAFAIVCKAHGGVAKLQSPKRVEKRLFDQKMLFDSALQEVKIHRRLSDRNISIIPKVHWTIIGDGRVGIGMEKAGSNLRVKYLNSRYLSSLKRLKKYAKRWLRGLAKIHDAGVLHGDLKPKNMTKKKILDFGISQLVEELNSKLLVCTRWYRPPEVILGVKNFTTKIDLFSLGAVLYELYSGVPLFDIEDKQKRARADLQQLHFFLDIMEMDRFPQSLMSEAKLYCMMQEIAQEKVLLPIEEEDRITEFEPFTKRMQRVKIMREDSDEEFSLWIDLLKGLLEFDPEKRLSAREALKHPFFEKKPNIREEEEEEFKEAPSEDVTPFSSRFASPNPFSLLMDEEMRV